MSDRQVSVVVRAAIDFTNEVVGCLQERGIGCELELPGGFMNTIKFENGKRVYIGPYVVYGDEKPDEMAKSLEAQWRNKQG